jgi:hypothetical protein
MSLTVTFLGQQLWPLQSSLSRVTMASASRASHFLTGVSSFDDVSQPNAIPNLFDDSRHEKVHDGELGEPNKEAMSRTIGTLLDRIEQAPGNHQLDANETAELSTCNLSNFLRNIREQNATSSPQGWHSGKDHVPAQSISSSRRVENCDAVTE